MGNVLRKIENLQFQQQQPVLGQSLNGVLQQFDNTQTLTLTGILNQCGPKGDSYELTEEDIQEITLTIIGQIDKAALGLENVDNTSDLNKPISIAMQEALDQKLDIDNVIQTIKVNNTIVPSQDGIVNIDLSGYQTIESQQQQIAELLSSLNMEQQIETGNIISSITQTDGIVSITTVPMPTELPSGLRMVKSNDSTIKIEDDGTLSIQSLDVSKLYVADGDEFILNCGESQ